MSDFLAGSGKSWNSVNLSKNENDMKKELSQNKLSCQVEEILAKCEEDVLKNMSIFSLCIWSVENLQESSY